MNLGSLVFFVQVISKCLLVILKRFKVLILIGGPSASGKSTLAKKLAKKINATVIEMDNFFYTKVERTDLDLGKNYDDPKVFNWELFHSTIEKILIDKKVNMPIYNKKNGTRKFKEVTANEVIIVEGIWALNKRTKLNTNLKIFLDVKSNVRLERRLSRDTWSFDRRRNKIIKNWVADVLPSEKRYILPDKKRADVIINEKEKEPINLILKLIKNKS